MRNTRICRTPRYVHCIRVQNVRGLLGCSLQRRDALFEDRMRLFHPCLASDTTAPRSNRRQGVGGHGGHGSGRFADRAPHDDLAHRPRVRKPPPQASPSRRHRTRVSPGLALIGSRAPDDAMSGTDVEVGTAAGRRQPIGRCLSIDAGSGRWRRFRGWGSCSQGRAWAVPGLVSSLAALSCLRALPLPGAPLLSTSTASQLRSWACRPLHRNLWGGACLV